MAIVAGVAARDVSRVFSCRGDAVVAGTAGSEHLRVFDGDNGRPCRRAVAVLAYIGRLNM